MKLRNKEIFFTKMVNAFSKICTDVIEKHAFFINPEISKAIITRTMLRNCFLKERSNENKKLFCEHRSKCVTATKSHKRLFYKFKWKVHNWKQMFLEIKPYLSNQVQSSERIKLAEEYPNIKWRGSCNEAQRFLLKCCN